nr:MAG TPA: hypothetical protein [Crassvirales sp.]
MFNNLDDIDMQIQKMEAYRQKLKQLKESQQSQPQKKLVWDEIDAEVAPMSNEQKGRLFQDADYMDIYNELQSIVQAELLNLVKGRIESTERGRELLTKQLNTVRKLKTKIINDTNREMELFKKFKEYSKEHPNTSYEEFIKENV